MASLKKISVDELRKARKSGFKRKSPKRPKRSAGLSVLESYIARYNAWVDDARSKMRDASKRHKLQKQVFC